MARYARYAQRTQESAQGQVETEEIAGYSHHSQGDFGEEASVRSRLQTAETTRMRNAQNSDNPFRSGSSSEADDGDDEDELSFFSSISADSRRRIVHHAWIEAVAPLPPVEVSFPSLSPGKWTDENVPDWLQEVYFSDTGSRGGSCVQRNLPKPETVQRNHTDPTDRPLRTYHQLSDPSPLKANDCCILQNATLLNKLKVPSLTDTPQTANSTIPTIESVKIHRRAISAVAPLGQLNLPRLAKRRSLGPETTPSFSKPLVPTCKLGDDGSELLTGDRPIGLDQRAVGLMLTNGSIAGQSSVHSTPSINVSVSNSIHSRRQARRTQDTLDDLVAEQSPRSTVKDEISYVLRRVVSSPLRRLTRLEEKVELRRSKTGTLT